MQTDGCHCTCGCSCTGRDLSPLRPYPSVGYSLPPPPSFSSNRMDPSIGWGSSTGRLDGRLVRRSESIDVQVADAPIRPHKHRRKGVVCQAHLVPRLGVSGSVGWGTESLDGPPFGARVVDGSAVFSFACFGSRSIPEREILRRLKFRGHGSSRMGCPGGTTHPSFAPQFSSDPRRALPVSLSSSAPSTSPFPSVSPFSVRSVGPSEDPPGTSASPPPPLPSTCLFGSPLFLSPLPSRGGGERARTVSCPEGFGPDLGGRGCEPMRLRRNQWTSS